MSIQDKIRARLLELHEHRQAARYHQTEASALEQEIAKAWPWGEDGPVMFDVPGVGMAMRHKKKNRTAWDKDGLRRLVLDSRLVDEGTGEIVDEAPVDKVLHVWNLGAPRLTALKARGIDPDEFCAVEDAGYTVEIRGDE